MARDRVKKVDKRRGGEKGKMGKGEKKEEAGEHISG